MANDYEKVLGIIKFLNLNLRNPTPDEHFRDRLIIQKITHISQFLGLGLNYDFNLYIKGPYSPQLTEDYYKFHNNESISSLNLSSASSLSNEEINYLKKIKNMIFSQPLFKSHKVDLLQAISTIMYFIRDTPSLSDEDLILKTKNEKPYLTDRIIWNAMNMVKSLKDS